MKKPFVLFLILTMLTLSACGSNIQSTDLTNITFDGVSVGNSFEQVETDKYTPTTRYPESDNTYNYEEWRVSVTDNMITEITASFEQISISVDGKEGCHSVDDVINILGDSYNSSWYDKEQSLMQIQYSDIKNGLQCVFVYDKNSGGLIWGIISAA